MSSSRDPDVKIKSESTSEETYLFNVSQNASSQRSNPEIDAIYSRESNETFIVDLEKEDNVSINGRASGIRISRYSKYSDDPLVALAEYATRLLAHVNANQGTGWTIENDYTGRTLPVVIEEVSIVKRRAEKFEFEFNISARIGGGLMPSQPIDPEPVDPSTEARLDGESLYEIEELRITKKQRLRTHTYATPRPVEKNEIESLTGSKREISIRGNVPGDESVRKSFDDAIRSNIGVNETVTFESAFPGRDYEVVIMKLDSVREAGQTQIGQYNIEAVEGTVGA